jgi:predicted enzyme related to lactoylglutathione lyase
MSWAEKIFANTLFIVDLERSKAFYAQVFEKSPIFEDAVSVVYQFGELLINLLSETEAIELIDPAKVASIGDGSRFQLTIHVNDVDAHAKRLKELGVQLINGPMDRPWGIRTLLFADPDGHLWELAQRTSKD